MAHKIVSDSVSQAKDGTWTYQCPATDGSCGDREAGVGFTSDNWPDRADAVARGEEHYTEHDTGEPAQELHDFMRSRNLIVDDDGKVKRVGFDGKEH